MTAKKTEKYIEAVGRRKTAVARVRITPSTKNSYIINDKDLESYFDLSELRNIVTDAHKSSGLTQQFSISIKVSGGGKHAQAESIRHGISRSIVSYDENLKPIIKKSGFLKRDARQVERKKPGLKKARKSPTWSKR
jgi:small subunit ribosomal protein S9